MFNFVVQLLQKKKNSCPRIIIFCTSIIACGQIATMLRLIQHGEIKYVQMYHSKIPESTKDEIKLDLDNPDGNIH